jgi:hypothetical protein
MRPIRKAFLMTDNAKFLSMVHQSTADAERAIDFLEHLIESPLPEEVKAEFVRIQSTLKVQNLLVRRLTEENQEIEDHVTDLIKKYTK